AELFVANGVTGVRDMYDSPTALRDARQAIQEGRRIGPRSVACGQGLNGRAENDHQLAIPTAQRGREAVRRQIRDGADFIKIYNGLARGVYDAIADECRKAGVPFAGHTPDAITTAQAAAAGQRSIEHLDAVLLDCSRNSAALRWSRVFI